MKVITKIEVQKKNRKRFNIYIDDKYSFSVHEDVLIANRILKGQELNEEEIKEILQEDEKSKIWHRALTYISFKSRTFKEVEQYLLRLDYQENLIKEALSKLERKKIIDDFTYAKLYIEQRINLKPRSKHFIGQELRKKGINEEHIQENLKIINDDVEYDLASRLLEKRSNKYKGEEWKVIRNKLGSYLARKGFSFDTVNKVLNEYKESLLDKDF